MALYVMRRLAGVVPVLGLVALGSFLLVHLVPGDPAMVMLGNDATPQQIQQLRAQMGLDRSLLEQFVVWVREALRGNLGESFFLGRPVSQALWERLPATMQLAVLALLFSLLIGVPAGVVAAVRQNSWWDQLVMLTAMGGISIPSFWLGLAMILVFSVGLGWLPSGGYVPLSEDLWQGLRTLVMPALSLGFMQAALIARMTRSSMLEVLRQDYVRTARAKGLAERVVVGRHAFRNALIPVITILGTQISDLLSGAVLTETIFAWPGIGRLEVEALINRDFPIMRGGIIFMALIFLVANLIVDLSYGFIDPRVRYD